MDLNTVTSLQTDFGRLFDENFKLRDKAIYNKQIASFNKRLESVGISSRLTPKEVELKLQQAYELLIKVPKFSEINRPNDMPVNSTLTPEQLKYFGEAADKRTQQNIDIRAREKQTIDDFIKQNQERIATAQKLQEKLRNKVIYAKVVLPEPLPLDEIEQKDLQVLREYAQNDTSKNTGELSPKQILISDLATKIEGELGHELDNLSLEQKELLITTTAVEIVEKIAKPEETYENLIQNSILKSVNEDGQNVLSNNLNDDRLAVLTKENAILLQQTNTEPLVFSEKISQSIFGNNITSAIYGPRSFETILSDNKIDGQTTHKIDLGSLNQISIQQRNHQNQFLENIKGFGSDKSREYFYGRFTSNARGYIAEKISKLPTGSLIKKAYSDPIVQSIFARYGLTSPVAWQATSQLGEFSSFMVRIAPNTANPVLYLASRFSKTQLVTPISTVTGGTIGASIAAQAASTYTSVALTGGVMAAEAFAGGAAGAAAGSVVPVVGTIIGAVAGMVGGQVFSAAMSKLKVWWTENKDKVGPAIAIGAGTLGALLFGAGPGLGIGLVVAGATVGFGTLATGAFGILGFIGRSVGIAIATPVIVTLLVLPPLVAFIMLVINNSAYVIPPAPPSLSQSSNPYISVIKTVEPSGPFENSDLPLTIKYTVTITAKRNTLTNISFKDTCKIVQEASTPPCTTSSFVVPDAISVASPYVITYENTYNVFTTDALVVNTFEVTATAGEGGEQTTSGAASIRIGNPPNQCFNIVENGFSADQYSYILGAISTLQGEYNGYASKICASLGGKSVDIRYAGNDPNYWGWWEDGYVRLYSRGVANQRDTNYILFHELAHVLATNDDSWYNQYISYPGITNEPHPYCFYDYITKTGAWPYSERFAEAAAFYADDRCGNFRQRNPAHYKFMNDVLFR
ncbi:MAG: hypothetical protein QY322_03120 [bacterium]|nr:MAG: hypothetical protein QY322_03120 [bacterium]